MVKENKMQKLYIISEIGINHNGDMNLAKELILKSKEAGCHAVKFQKRDIDSVYTKEELDAARESPWGKTNREQKVGLEFSAEKYKELYDYTKSLGMDFGVSCWDTKSVDLIDNVINVDFHKVASALLTNKEFLEKLNETGKPVIVSTGMSTQQQIDSAMKVLKNVTHILACTSTYPTKPEELNLKYIQNLKNSYPEITVGFSNHYSGHDACVASVILGAECVEFHITKDRTMYGSDQAASIENAKELVDGMNKALLMLGTGEKSVFESEKLIAKKLRKVTSL
jgi:N-acetylneuraminate synthase